METWYKIGDKWATGWMKIDGHWHYFYSDGRPAMASLKSSWVKIDGRWYSFDANGCMRANTLTEEYPKEYYVGADGLITQIPNGWVRNSPNSISEGWRYRRNNEWVKGWQLIGGKWYCFYESGDLVMNSLTLDGYYVDKNGVWNNQGKSNIDPFADLR